MELFTGTGLYVSERIEIHFSYSPSQIFWMAYFVFLHILGLLCLLFHCACQIYFFPLLSLSSQVLLHFTVAVCVYVCECVCVAIPQGKHFISDLLPLINYKIK